MNILPDDIIFNLMEFCSDSSLRKLSQVNELFYEISEYEQKKRKHYIVRSYYKINTQIFSDIIIQKLTKKECWDFCKGFYKFENQLNTPPVNIFIENTKNNTKNTIKFLQFSSKHSDKLLKNIKMDFNGIKSFGKPFIDTKLLFLCSTHRGSIDLNKTSIMFKQWYSSCK